MIALKINNNNLRRLPDPLLGASLCEWGMLATLLRVKGSEGIKEPPCTKTRKPWISMRNVKASDNCNDVNGRSVTMPQHASGRGIGLSSVVTMRNPRYEPNAKRSMLSVEASKTFKLHAIVGDRKNLFRAYSLHQFDTKDKHRQIEQTQ